jgi:hypothetical protein
MIRLRQCCTVRIGDLRFVILLTDFPSGDPVAQGFNAANNFMPRDARQVQTRVDASDRARIGVTDSACFHPNPNLTC